MAQVLALPPHSKKVMGSIPAWGAVGSGGQVLPRPSVLRWAISWAFLCGVCMFSPCSQGVSSANNPNRKTCKKNRTILSVPDRDGRFTWSPGAEKLPTAPGGSWRKDGPGWVKCRAYISQRPQACVCVLCRLHKNTRVCCSVPLVAIKELTEVSLVCVKPKTQ